jgi:hypothetical protein
MSSMLQPLRLDEDDRARFAVFHPAIGRMRASLLICPPFLHEHAMGYRLFAMLAGELAQRGIAVMRFDYYGLGDSDGEDTEFSLEGALGDAGVALDALKARTGGVAPIVLGVRGGAFAAAALAETAPLRGLWLWQPVLDGAAYVAGLDEIDRAHRTWRRRYPNGGGERVAAGGPVVVGLPFPEALRAELCAARLARGAKWPPLTLIEPADSEPAFAGTRRIALAPGLHEWAARVDIDHFPPPAVRDLAERLAASPEIPR